jgi:hypothetical protein
MSMSRSRAMPSGVKAIPNSRSAESVQARGGPAQSGVATAPRGPEWKSERWKLQVEAEARSRLKRSIRKVGSER